MRRCAFDRQAKASQAPVTHQAARGGEIPELRHPRIALDNVQATNYRIGSP